MSREHACWSREHLTSPTKNKVNMLFFTTFTNFSVHQGMYGKYLKAFCTFSVKKGERRSKVCNKMEKVEELRSKDTGGPTVTKA